ncbi:MAG: sigma-54-dependent Fis family transcriptional regulator [Acidobacteria bacterium]|nr:sigma-54-dependent Fis family transcriptional regulator [Acidobacteriota bacterium]
MSKQCLGRSCGILVVDDDEVLTASLAKVLRQRFSCVYEALSGAEAVAILSKENNICLVLVDLIMPVMDGLSVLEYIRQADAEASVVLMTGFGTIETAVEAIKRGAEDYITKPFDSQTVLKKVSRLMELYELKARVAGLELQNEPGSPFASIVTGSPAMRKVIDRARVAALSSAPVLLVGETGTGKEMMARAIHFASPRAAQSFVPVNCAALPQELVESELFGYRKGAFTGALSDHRGLFQAAHQGTLFLDEIAEMPMSAQAKLLRVLEEGEVRPVGETVPHQVDVRVISASNRPLSELASTALREDLFFRVSTIVIELPPLRKRPEDLCLLVQHFLREFSQKYGRRISIDRGAANRLSEYSFPGNVRELRHILESAVALSADNPQMINERDLTPVLRSQTAQPAVNSLPANVGADCSLEALEKFAIRQALRVASDNKSRAAELLGLSRGALYRKLREYGLDADQGQPLQPAKGETV